ncbi:hypothetical protein HYT24_02035 [Candidatus Pacearchaeota archaeon]|nr:hypothetical protein [Candidatus Pacearchaeota archaeon]
MKLLKDSLRQLEGKVIRFDDADPLELVEKVEGDTTRFSIWTLIRGPGLIVTRIYDYFGDNTITYTDEHVFPEKMH